MKVKRDSSCSFFQSCVLYAFTVWRGVVGREARFVASDALLVTEETSAAVLPRREIFLSRRVLSGRVGSLKGGLRRPSLEIMNFWLDVGTESSDATDSERSVIVAEEGKEKV